MTELSITPEIYRTMKRAYQQSDGDFTLHDQSIDVRRIPVISKRYRLDDCFRLSSAHGETAEQLLRYYLQNNECSRRYVFRDLKDAEIVENARYSYDVFFPNRYAEHGDVIILFHGLNERYWYKYLPWAALLASYTGYAVILFPLAFHMGRAPADWSNPRIMQSVAAERRALFSSLKYASLANAAISQRLQFEPDRFLSSGIQSFMDVTAIMRSIKEGRNGFLPGATIHFFGYSLGALLAEVILMSDPDGLTESSRLFLFCGGSVVEHTKPVSKAILDEQAYRAVSGYLKQLRIADVSRLSDDPVLAEGMKYFIAMLTFSAHRELRESRLLEISDRVLARSMKGDDVCPPDGISGTLRGRCGKIPIDVKEVDFPYPCRHEDPFPRRSDPDAVSTAYREVFREAASFYLS